MLRQANQRGTTILMASHDLNFISPLAGRIIPMAGGRISELSRR